VRLALIVVSLAVLALASAATSASAATRCSLSGKERRLGPTYTTSLAVTGVSCATGERLVRAYYRCRVRNGGRKGRCRTRVLGFRCTETRESISTQFDARVTCRRGDDRVRHDYTQFT
jgi:hypothetical protein